MNAPTLRGLAVLALLCLLPRASALTITYLSDGRAITQTGQTNASLLPTSPFSDFSGTLNASGVMVYQTSSLGAFSMSSSGGFSAFQSRGNTITQFGSALFQVTFSIDQAAVYEMKGYRMIMGFGIADISLTGPSGTLVSWANATPPNNYAAHGVLLPGTYTLRVNDRVGILPVGTEDATQGNYRVALAFSVPDFGNPLALFFTSLAVACAIHRRLTPPRRTA